MQGPHKPIEIFCSYAHEDEAHLQKLETHLSMLKRQGLISTWHDRQITAGITSLLLEGIPQEDIPELLVKKGVDAKKVLLIAPANP